MELLPEDGFYSAILNWLLGTLKNSMEKKKNGF